MTFLSAWIWLPLIQSLYLHGGYAEESQGMPPVNAVVYSTQEQCLEQYSRTSTGGNFVVGSFDTKGCFSINNDIYFGTGGTVDEMHLSDSDLPGMEVRIWCDKDNTSPSMQPSDRPILVSTLNSAPGANPANLSTRSTNRPTAMQSIQLPTPVLVDPISKPSPVPVTKQPTVHPMSNKPSSSNQTNPSVPLVSSNPTSQPFQTVPASTQPTHNATSAPSVANPAPQLNSDIDVADSKNSTIHPSPMPVTKPPTANPSNEPSSLHPTKQPTLAPSTVSPSMQPSTMPVSKQPTKNPTPMPSAASPTTRPTLMPGLSTSLTDIDSSVPQEEQDTVWHPVGISPLAISLIADPQTQAVDINELTLFVLNHLLTAMKDERLSIEGSSSYVLVSPVPKNHEQPQGTHQGFIFTGLFYFSGDPDSVPTVALLDTVAQRAFAGENGKQFVHTLQNAEDVGLQSTRSVSAVASSESNEVEDVVVESTLNSADANPIAINRWYVLAIVFGIGLLLIAMKVAKSYHDRSAIPKVSCYRLWLWYFQSSPVPQLLIDYILGSD